MTTSSTTQPQWSADVQRLAIAVALRGGKVPESYYGMLDPELFASANVRGPKTPRQRIADAILSHYGRYKSVTAEVVEGDVQRAAENLGPEVRAVVLQEWSEVVGVKVPEDPAAVVDVVTAQARRRRVERGLIQAAEVVEAGDVERAEEIMLAAARPVGAAAGLGNGLAVMRRFDEIEESQVDWLWTNHVARGSLTIISGDPGLGKSKITMDLAARHSRGLTWPDGEASAGAGVTVVLSAEDNSSYTIKPRLIAMRADQSKIYMLDGVREKGGERQLSLDTDLDVLERAIVDTGADMVVVDPASAYLGRVDSWKDADLRRVLGPVAKLAERTRVAVIAVMHLTKSQDRKALLRIQGSVGFGAAARLVFGTVQDENVDGRRLLLPLKNNLGPYPPALAFDPTAGLGIAWEAAPVAMSEAEVEGMFQPQRRPDSAPQREEAEQFLREVLADGAKLAVAVKVLARQKGISMSTLRRAREALDVGDVRQGFGGSVQWRLPAGDAEARGGETA